MRFDRSPFNVSREVRERLKKKKKKKKESKKERKKERRRRKKERRKAEGFPISHFYRSFLSGIVAVKGLKTIRDGEPRTATNDFHTAPELWVSSFFKVA